jgi:hypothetical protein
VIRATLVSVFLLAAVAADEGISVLTEKAWWLPVFGAVWIGSNAVGNLLARVLPPLHGSVTIWRYRISLDFEPRAASPVEVLRKQ